MTVELDLSNGNIPGLPKNIEIKNAAQEETLAELLKLFQQYKKTFDKTAKTNEKTFKSIDKLQKNQQKANSQQSSPNSKKSNNQPEDRVEEFTERVDEASDAMNTYLKRVGASTLQQIGLANATGKVIGAISSQSNMFFKLGSRAAEVIRAFQGIGNSSTQAASALHIIPGIGQALSSTFGAVATASEEVYSEYVKLAASGANFSGSMTAMVNSATSAGLTMEQMVSIISSNSQSMMLLGGTTEKGAKRFVELGKAMRDSDVNAQLLNMGYTTEQINSGMASYINVLGQSGQLSKMSNKEITEGSAKYLKELDALAKITGKSREEKQKEQEALQRDAQYRAMTMKMSAEEKQEMLSFISSFPESSQGAIKDMLATGTATTEEAKKFAALNGKSAAEIMRHGSNLRKGVKVSAESLNQTKRDTIKEAKLSAERFRDQGAYNKDMTEAWNTQYELAQQDENGKEKAMEEQENVAKQSEKMAKQMGEFKSKIATISNSFTEQLLNPRAMESLEYAFTSLATYVSAIALPTLSVFFSILQPVIKVFGAIATIVGNLVGPALSMMASVIGWVSDGLTFLLTPLDWIASAAKWAGYVIAGLAAVVLVSKAAYIAHTAITMGLTAKMVLQTAAYAAQTMGMFVLNAVTQQTVVAKLLELVSVRQLTMAKWQLGFSIGALRATVSTMNFEKIKEIAATTAATAMKYKDIAVSATLSAAQSAYIAVTNSSILMKLREIGVTALGLAVSGAYSVAMAFAAGATWLFGVALATPLMPLLLLGAAITLAVVYWDEIVAGFKWGWNILKNVFGWIVDGLTSFFEGWISIVMAPFKMVANVVMGVVNFFGDMVAAIKDKLSWFFSDDDNEKPESKPRKETGAGQRSDGTTRTVKKADPFANMKAAYAAEQKRKAQEKAQHEERMKNAAAVALGMFGFETDRLKKLKEHNKLQQEQDKKRIEIDKSTNKELEKAAEKNKSFWDKIFGKSDSESGSGTTRGGTNKPGTGPGKSGTGPGKPGGSNVAASNPDRKVGGMAAASANAQSGSDSSSGGSNSSSSSSSGGKDGGSFDKTGLPGSDKLPSAGLKGGGGGSMSDKDIKNMIIKHEGKKNKPYKDTKGLWTVGVGHLIGDGKTLPPEWDKTFSEEEIMKMFDEDYAHHRSAAEKIPGFNKMNPTGQGALTDLTFNMGPSWYKKWPTFSKHMAAGNASGAADSLQQSAWYGQVKSRAPTIVDMVRRGGIQAAEGGVFDGPKSGYPATLHGNEAVVPLKDGNIPVQLTGDNNQQALVELLSKLNDKLDILISINAAISESNKSQLRVQKKGLGNPELLM